MKENSLLIDISKDNYNLVKININEKWIYIGSKYNMADEIDKFLEKVKKGKNIIVFGAAAGEHIKALREKYEEAEIRVFEPNKEVKKYVENLKFIKDDSKIKIIGCSNDEIRENLDKQFINEFNVQDINIVAFSNYEKLYAEEFISVVKKAKDIIYDSILERNTKMRFSERWFTTTMTNLEYMANSTLFDEYKGAYKDKPAVIVSAGPSLDKNIDELRGREDEFLIITGGRPLKGLIEKGINPGLLVALDPQEVNYRLVKGAIEDTNIPLLFFDCTNEKIVENHKGIKMFSFSSEEMYQFLDAKCIPLSTYGSVAHSMVSAAINLGCNPIIFIGQDFAYTNDAAHSEFLEEKLVKESKKFNEVKSEGDLYVDSVNGGKVRTSIVLNIYRLGMEKIIAHHPDIKFINATEGGARMSGTEEMTLKNAMKKYGGNKVQALEYKEPDPILRECIIKKIELMHENLLKIEKKCRKALKYTEELEKNLKIEGMGKTNQLLNELDKIDTYIKNKIKSFLIIQTLLYPIMYSILSQVNIDDKSNREDKIKNIIEQNKELYGTFIDVIQKTSEDFTKIREKI